MFRTLCTRRSTKSSLLRPFSTSRRYNVRTIDTAQDDYYAINLDEFRDRAFTPEKPLLMTKSPEAASAVPRVPFKGIPAAYKWFSELTEDTPMARPRRKILSQKYMSKYRDVILPYELVLNTEEDEVGEWIKEYGDDVETMGVVKELRQHLANFPGNTFHQFNAPLSLFLQACKTTGLKQIYIAQAQIADLPAALQQDLPTPQLVKAAGRGDIYDANVWLGLPPTYTPLHKDPNPNLFVQLASSKKVRLFEPRSGAAIFRDVQYRIGQQPSLSFRGNEMMEGPERVALDHAVWVDTNTDVFEVTVHPGDALFIPKGWWHSIKSVGTDVTASANWWFR